MKREDGLEGRTEEENCIGETTETQEPQEPQEPQETPPKKGKRRKKALAIVLAVVFAFTCFFSGFIVYWLILDEDVRTLIRIKNKIQKEYYEEVTDEAFYDAVAQSVAEYKRADGYTDADFFEAAYTGINTYLLDEYSAYMTEEEYEGVQQQATGQQSGIGAYFLRGYDDTLVYRVAGNSPAEEAGLQRGDTIVGVGNTPSEILLCEDRSALSLYISSVAVGETFYMQWRTADGEIKLAPLAKGEYIENYVYYKTNDVSYGFVENASGTWQAKTVGEPLAYLNADTAYIQIVQFNGDADAAFDSAMRLFAADGKTDLIVDLRGNGGGYMNIFQSIAKYFCKDAGNRNRPIVAIADYGEKKEKFRATGNIYADYFSADSRITVLADESTASASECLIGCMYGYGAIGYDDICLVEDETGAAHTFGKGIMQTTYTMAGIGALKLTTAKIFWPPNGTYSIHGVGVTSADGTKTVSYALSYSEQTQAAIASLYATGE